MRNLFDAFGVNVSISGCASKSDYLHDGGQVSTSSSPSSSESLYCIEYGLRPQATTNIIIEDMGRVSRI
jgi:hypothetical protein